MIRYLKTSTFVRVKIFPMYGGIGVSAPSLHRESTDTYQGNGQRNRPMHFVQLRKINITVTSDEHDLAPYRSARHNYAVVYCLRQLKVIRSTIIRKFLEWLH